MSQKRIEIEFRSIFSKKEYARLKKFLDEKALNQGVDDKDVFFYIFPDKVFKVVNNVFRNSAKIVLKLNKIGIGSDFEEIEIPIDVKEVDNAVKMFAHLGSENIMHSFQKRRNYIYQGVKIALKFSDAWGYHAELEILVDDRSKKIEAEEKIKKVAKDLKIKLMKDLELKQFVEKKELEYKKALNL